MRPATLRTWLSGFACAAVMGSAVLADDVKPATGDSQARRVLDDVAKAYKSLAAYSDHGEFVTAMTIGGRAEKQVDPLHFHFARPNKLELSAGPVRVVSDGKTLTTSVAPFKKYQVVAAPGTISRETFREGPAGAMLFGGPTAPVTFILTTLLVGEDAAPTILKELGGTLKIEAGAPGALVLLIDREKGTDFRLMVDPATKLLQGIEMVVDAKELSETLERKVTVERVGWTAGAVSTEAPKPQVFVFDPPKAFAKVESFAAAVGEGGAEVSKYRVHDLLGKPAPDFSLSVLDEGGKFKSVTKADLAGKVVLIDFWQTWCRPCLEELPEVQKLIEAYAKDKKDVVVVALSLDERPSEIRDVRRLVETTLENKHIVLTGNSVGKIAVDPSGTIGEAFQVEYFPTVVLLDAKGIVQSAHIGSSPDVREVLGKEIDTLLSGKPLAKPGAK